MSEGQGAEFTYRTIHDLPGDDRPREKLLKHGAGVLSDAELIALIVGSGTRGENVLDLARRLVGAAGGLAGLTRTDPKALQRTKGLGPARAAQLAAAIELGRRAQQLDPADRPLLTTPEAVHTLMRGQFIGKTREELHVLSLDTRGRLLGRPQPLPGSVNSVGLRPAEVFREPIVLDAVSVILVHNHPSGDPAPSPQDVSVTRTLEEVGRMLEIRVLDHVIVGTNSYVSLHRDGYAFRADDKVRKSSKKSSE